MLRLLVIVTTVWSSQGFPHPQNPQTPPYDGKQQVFFVPQRQQYNPGLQYDLSVLQPQFQIPPYNFIGDKQPFPSVQPQIVLYHGGAPGQPFLLQPGGSPPGNFLVPQGGPNVILRDPSQAPTRPVFVAGYPKPAHIPPIEKDAEEVPTNPSKIPPLKPSKDKKPEKLETFNEDDTSGKQATEADVLAAADRNPAFNPKANLRPGQRFFILNGQPLFSTYPYNNNVYPGINLKYSNFAPPPLKKFTPYQTPFFKNKDTEQLAPKQAEPQQPYPENLILLNQAEALQDDIFKNSQYESLKTKDQPLFRDDFGSESDRNFGLFHLRDSGEQDDAIVVDVQQDQLNDEENTTAEVEDEVTAPEKQNEPTIAQAQPGAIALAGPGGVAAAAPRGTAFVGKDGVAVSSPRATAVAGPSREEGAEEKKKKQNKRRP